MESYGVLGGIYSTLVRSFVAQSMVLKPRGATVCWVWAQYQKAKPGRRKTAETSTYVSSRSVTTGSDWDCFTILGYC